MLGEACRQVAGWNADGVVCSDFSVAVNVSGVQLAHSDLVAHVRAALAASGLPARCLTLEVTETAVVDLDEARGRLLELEAIGVRIAIDDFGTGHSSLAYLKDLPADVVKMPRSFVREAGRSEAGTAMIHGIAGLAIPLGLVVLAEGVETREQRACVIEAGAQLIQGYFYAARATRGADTALVDAVRAAASGRTYLDPGLGARMVEEPAGPDAGLKVGSRFAGHRIDAVAGKAGWLRLPRDRRRARPARRAQAHRTLPGPRSRLPLAFRARVPAGGGA